MAMVGTGHLEPAGGPQDRIQHARLWLVPVAIVIVMAGLVWVGIRAVDWFGRRIGEGVGQALFKAIALPGTASSQAAGVATTEGVSPDSLTPSILNARMPAYLWLPAASPVPLSSSAHRTPMGVSVAPGHVLTASRLLPGSCSYGLTVTNPLDPMIREDHLPGVGTYYLFATPAPECVAAAGALPTSAWVPLRHQTK